jgi:hypothetical protein
MTWHTSGLGFQQRQTAPLAHGFFRLLHAAELHQRSPPRFLWRQARAPVVRDVHLEVRGKFVAQMAIELFFTEQAAQAVNKGANRLHRCLTRTAAQSLDQPVWPVALERSTPET